MENQTQKFCSISLLFSPAFRPLNYGAALKIERKMSRLNIAFDRYASIGTVMHYILVISEPGLQYIQYFCNMCCLICFIYFSKVEIAEFLRSFRCINQGVEPNRKLK